MKGKRQHHVTGTLVGLFTGHESISTCNACGARVVWARDDRFPENAKIGDLVNAEPTEPTTRSSMLVLWYEITKTGKPVGQQWFRLLEDPTTYTGRRWSRHLDTCSQQHGVINARRV